MSITRRAAALAARGERRHGLRDTELHFVGGTESEGTRLFSPCLRHAKRVLRVLAGRAGFQHGLLALAGILSAASLSAQAPNTPSARLAKATRLTCTFPTMATGTWTDGVPQAAVKPAKLTVAFNSIDTQDGTAESVGDSGKSHITVRLAGSYLTLMQMDPYGALYVTTVFDRESRAGKLLAAHSRHEYTPVQLPGLTSRPEQYYGDCEITPK